MQKKKKERKKVKETYKIETTQRKSLFKCFKSSPESYNEKVFPEKKDLQRMNRRFFKNLQKTKQKENGNRLCQNQRKIF